MLADAKALQSKYSDRAEFVSVNVNDASDRGVVTQYGADRSPLPLTIVVAPNGAVTAGFPDQIKKADFASVFVSRGMANVLKVLQSHKLAAVCFQNPGTKHNRESLAAANGLKSDPRFASAVEIVKIDPADHSEAKFVQQCKVSSSSPNAQLVILAPPGKIVGKFEGATSKDTVVASLMKSLGGGCRGGSCGPGCCGK